MNSETTGMSELNEPTYERSAMMEPSMTDMTMEGSRLDAGSEPLDNTENMTLIVHSASKEGAEVSYSCHPMDMHPLAKYGAYFDPRALNPGLVIQPRTKVFCFKFTFADLAQNGYCLSKPLVSDCDCYTIGDLMRAVHPDDVNHTLKPSTFAVYKAAVVDFFSTIDAPMCVDSPAFKGTCKVAGSRNVAFVGGAGYNCKGDRDEYELVIHKANMHTMAYASCAAESPDVVDAYVKKNKIKDKDSHLYAMAKLPGPLVSLANDMAKEDPEFVDAHITSDCHGHYADQDGRHRLCKEYRSMHENAMPHHCCETTQLTVAPPCGWEKFICKWKEMYAGSDSDCDSLMHEEFEVTIVLEMSLYFPYIMDNIVQEMTLRNDARETAKRMSRKTGEDVPPDYDAIYPNGN